MDNAETAASQFAGGLNCSQAILSTYAGQFGLDNETAVKLAAGFGGGMGRRAETCGAVSGAIMVLGLRYGAASLDPAAKEAVYARVRQFADQFRERNGSLLCRELLDCDISTPAGLEAAKKASLFATVCPKFVRDAAEILDAMLAEAGP